MRSRSQPQLASCYADPYASAAPNPWTAEEGANDSLMSLDDLLDQISEVNCRPPPRSTPAARPPRPSSTATKATTGWRVAPATGNLLDKSVGTLRQTRERWKVPDGVSGFKPGGWEHTESSFGPQPSFLRDREKDWSVWDQQRISAPERSYPSRGVVGELYDHARKDKPPWNPSSHEHTGRCFSMEAPPLIKSRMRQSSRSTSRGRRAFEPAPSQERETSKPVQLPRSRSTQRLTSPSSADHVPGSLGSRLSSATRVREASLGSRSRQTSASRVRLEKMQPPDPSGAVTLHED